MIRYSVIIPVFRVEHYLRQCVDSVLAQSFKNFEVILVDDGSPDNSPVICDEYASRDERIHVVHKTNGGLSSARNAGLDVAQGEYVMFLDSDDWWDDFEALAEIDECLRSVNSDVVIIGMKKYFTQDDIMGDIRIPRRCDKETCALSHAQVLQKYMQSNVYVACACDKVVRRSLIEGYNLRFVQGQLSEDIEWCVKLLFMDPSIDVLEACFYVYRQGNVNSITSNISRKNVLHVHDIIVKYATHDSAEPVKHYLANQFILLLSFSNMVKYGDIADLMVDCKNYWWLINYNWYPYVRKASLLKWMGMENLRKLLGIYLRYKRNL